MLDRNSYGDFALMIERLMGRCMVDESVAREDEREEDFESPGPILYNSGALGDQGKSAMGPYVCMCYVCRVV